MTTITNTIKRPNFYLPLLLLFIFGDVICDNYIFKIFNNQTHAEEFFLFFSVLVLQVIASPIQSTLSDIYGRKNGLIVSLFFSLISLILSYVYSQIFFLFFPLLILTIVLKGAFGNTIPLALAGIADTQEKNVRFSFGISTASYAIGYLLIVFANKNLHTQQAMALSILLFCILSASCILFLKEISNKDPALERKKKSIVNSLTEDFKTVLNSLKIRHTRKALIAFLLWEISLYSILLLYVDFNVQDFSSIAIAMLCGALFGVVFLKIFKHIKDNQMIKIGYNCSALSLLPFFLIIPFTRDVNFLLLGGCYFIHTLGNTLLTASLFSLLSRATLPHERGRIYGLLESTDTIAFLIASICIMLYNFFSLSILFIIFVSYLTVTISWIPYAQFKKTKLTE
jgi:MFS family permease